MSFTDEDREAVAVIAHRHGFSPRAAEAMLSALVSGNARQAQFDDPEFGGMGQWSDGGMLMIGDMFNSGLKSRVGDLVRDLTGLVHAQAQRPPASVPPRVPGTSDPAWPPGLGVPSASGTQNGMDYAVFPAARRLAIRRNGQVSLYDTGDHRISGVSQQQGGTCSLLFTSQHGPVPLDSLVPAAAAEGPSEKPDDPARPEAASGSPPTDDAILATIEGLHALLSRGILTQAEFDAKKAELLNRL